MLKFFINLFKKLFGKKECITKTVMHSLPNDKKHALTKKIKNQNTQKSNFSTTIHKITPTKRIKKEELSTDEFFKNL